MDRALLGMINVYFSVRVSSGLWRSTATSSAEKSVWSSTWACQFSNKNKGLAWFLFNPGSLNKISVRVNDFLLDCSLNLNAPRKRSQHDQSTPVSVGLWMLLDPLTLQVFTLLVSCEIRRWLIYKKPMIGSHELLYFGIVFAFLWTEHCRKIVLYCIFMVMNLMQYSFILVSKMLEITHTQL